MLLSCLLVGGVDASGSRRREETPALGSGGSSYASDGNPHWRTVRHGAWMKETTDLVIFLPPCVGGARGGRVRELAMLIPEAARDSGGEHSQGRTVL